MRKRLIRISHFMNIFTFFDSIAAFVVCIHKFGCQTSCH